MTATLPNRSKKASEDGYVLVAVIFMLALLIIAMAVAVPVVRKSIQREQEYETMQRGKQYARAVRLYYKKFGRYPPNIDALVMTNQIRFLRKKYVDPTTGKEEWKAIQFGQNKAPTAMGFFGQPLAGSNPGVPTAGLNGLNGGAGGPSSAFGSNPGGSSSGVFGSISNSLNQNSNSGSATTPAAGTDNSATGSGSASGATTSGTDANGNPITTGSGTGTTASSGLSSTGPTIGGVGIIGFSPNSPKQSLRVYKKKNHYNEWEFTWDPASDQMIMQGGNTGIAGQPGGSANPTNNNGFGSTSSGGSSFGSSFGSSGNSTGSSGSSNGSGNGSGSGSGSGNGSTIPPQQ
jgi:type II secretory pathway pseudopilin PulG